MSEWFKYGGYWIKQVDEVSYEVSKEGAKKPSGGAGDYLVWLSQGRFTCDCQGWQFYGMNPDFNCSHINTILKLREEKKDDGKG